MLFRNKTYITKSGINYTAPKQIIDKIFRKGYKICISGKAKYRTLQVYTYIDGKKTYICMLSHLIKKVNPSKEYVTYKDGNRFNLRKSNIVINKYN